MFKFSKSKKLKNALLWKKGSYSVIITAIFLAVIVALNILVSSLSSRLDLEIDLTAEKKHTISEESLEYIKGIDSEIKVIVLSSESAYADNYVNLLYEAGVITSYTDTTVYYEYFEQTVSFLNKYQTYNKNIDVEFLNTQSSEYVEIVNQYYADTSSALMCDIIVVGKDENGVEKSKILSLTDVYVFEEEQDYYGYSSTSTIAGNDIENALTGALVYTTSEIDTKVAFLTGHSDTDVTSSFSELLNKNSYEYTMVEDKTVTEIPEDCDVVVIPGATRDFSEEEIKALSQFLDNDGKLGKGLVVYATATAEYLDNLYGFLGEWGIIAEDGILYETSSQYLIGSNNVVVLSANSGEDESFDEVNQCLTGYNLPLKATEETIYNIEVTPLVETFETVVNAPRGVSSNWEGYTGLEASEYCTVVESVKTTYDDDNEQLNSYVTAFSSTDFLESDYSELSGCTNKEATLDTVRRAAGEKNVELSIVPKTIEEDESFYDNVTEAKSNAVRNIFMFLVPLAVIVTGIIIFVRRRNA